MCITLRSRNACVVDSNYLFYFFKCKKKVIELIKVFTIIMFFTIYDLKWYLYNEIWYDFLNNINNYNLLLLFPFYPIIIYNLDSRLSMSQLRILSQSTRAKTYYLSNSCGIPNPSESGILSWCSPLRVLNRPHHLHGALRLVLFQPQTPR